MRDRPADPDRRDSRATWPRSADVLPPNPYAVPLTTLVAGAYVAVTEQTIVHDAGSSSPDVNWDVGPGADADGDGD